MSIVASPTSAGPGAPSTWSGMKQSDVAKWAAGQLNGTRVPEPQAQQVKGSVRRKDERLFVVKIQVTKPSRVAAACYAA